MTRSAITSLWCFPLEGDQVVDETFMLQAAALFWVLVCFFRVGAMTKGLVMSRSRWIEIAQAAVIGVVLFGFLTDWRGLRHYTPDPLGQNLLPIHPIEYGLRDGERWAHLAPRHTADSRLRNTAITRDPRVKTFVFGQARNERGIDVGCFHAHILTEISLIG